MNIIKSPKTVIFFAITFIAFLIACKDDETLPTSENKILIGNTIFKNYPNDPLIISAATINGDSLQITFGASCCDGNNWTVQLVGSGDVLYSSPPQRSIRLSLKNYEICAAVCSKTLKFDLIPTKVNGNQIILKLDGWDQPLIYKY